MRGEHDARDAVGGLKRRAAALEAGEEPGALRVLSVQAPGRVPRARRRAEPRIDISRRGVVVVAAAEPGDRGGQERDVRVFVAELQRGPELAHEARHRELAELPQGLALGGGDRERRAGGVQPEHGVVPEVHLDAPVLQEHRAEHVGNRAGVHQGGQAQRGQRGGLVGLRRRGRGHVVPRVREVHPLGLGERIVRLGARRGRRRDVPRPRVRISRHRQRGWYLSRVPARRDRRPQSPPRSCAGESVLGISNLASESSATTGRSDRRFPRLPISEVFARALSRSRFTESEGAAHPSRLLSYRRVSGRIDSGALHLVHREHHHGRLSRCLAAGKVQDQPPLARSLDTAKFSGTFLGTRSALPRPRPCRTPPPPGRRSDAARRTSRSCAFARPRSSATRASASPDARLRVRSTPFRRRRERSVVARPRFQALGTQVVALFFSFLFSEADARAARANGYDTTRVLD